MIVEKCLNYGLGAASLWLAFIFEKILESLNNEEGEEIQNRLVIEGYQIDSPKFDQDSHPTIVIQQLRKENWVQPRIGGRTSTSITTMRKYKFGINVTGDQGRIYELFFYHYYNGSPQFLEWNTEFADTYSLCVPEFASDEAIDINNLDEYGVGQSWIISFLYILDYSSSPVNIENIEIPANAIIAELL